jgi:hypothetical protein
MSHRAFDGYVTTQTTNGVDGQETIIRGQTATGTGSKGGNVILTAGKGVAQDGYISFRSASGSEIMRVGNTGFKDVTVDGYLHVTGNTTLDGYLYGKGLYNRFDGYIRTDGYLIVDGYTTIDGYTITFDGYAVAPLINQSAMPMPGVDGYATTIKAQDSTASPARGGNLELKGGDGYNGDGTIRDGYVKLYSGSTEQARVSANRFWMLTGQRIKTTSVATSPYDVLEGHYAIMVDTSSARTVNLPPNPLNGDVYVVKDSTGNASSNTITVNGNGRNINGGADHTISTNYGFASFVYDEDADLWFTI